MTDHHHQPLTETQALAWLHGQPDGTIATTVSDLARTWGWNRSTTSRRVKVWVASGQLVRTPGPDGRSVFTARTADAPQPCDTTAVPASPSAKSLAYASSPTGLGFRWGDIKQVATQFQILRDLPMSLRRMAREALSGASRRDQKATAAGDSRTMPSGSKEFREAELVWQWCSKPILATREATGNLISRNWLLGYRGVPVEDLTAGGGNVIRDNAVDRLYA